MRIEKRRDEVHPSSFFFFFFAIVPNLTSHMLIVVSEFLERLKHVYQAG